MDHNAPYRIRICNCKDIDWAVWFDDFVVEKQENGEIHLYGLITDQSEMHGLLNKVRELDFTLISIEQLNSLSDRPDEVMKAG